MIDPKQLRDRVVRPVLVALDLPTDRPTGGAASCELLLGTAMQESKLTYLAQLGGPALGLCQMEPATFGWLLGLLKTSHQDLLSKMQGLVGSALVPDMLAGNLYLSFAMARLRYYVVPDALPAQGDYVGQAAYWKQHYNTPAGAGTTQEYLNNWAVLRAQLK